MVFLEKHNDELNILKRRIQFLMILDDLLERDATPEEAYQIAKQFSKVEKPADVIKRIQEIYGPNET